MMATETILSDGVRVIAVSSKETADLIGLLAAQLAQVPLCNNSAGAAPSINIVEHGIVKYQLVLCLEK